MLKTALFISLFSVLVGCKDHHGHEAHPAWSMEVTIGEEGPTMTMPVLMDNYVSAITYSPVTFHAEPAVMKGHVLHRAFSLYSEGEQKVLTEVKCDTRKQDKPGVAGEAQLSLLGTTVKFTCAF